ncbi:hypothetical protein ACFSJW_07135 [Flavobacterium artemisiae]|uniref:Uncharacterized protein n=1 Tax=Flavobacterium artemisiae TaxID=2126556 RepID=A0ABW4HCJ9_9FLAO
MKKIFTPTTFFIFSILFLVFAFGLKSYKKGGNIDSIESVENFIKGKWHDEIVSRGGLITYYRFEITDTQIRCWKSNMILSNTGRSSDNITSDWTEQPPVTLSIGSVQEEAESSSSYAKKIRSLGNCSYGTYTFEHNEKLGNALIFKEINASEGFHTGKLDKGWEY